MLEKGSMLVMEPSTAGEGRAILEETASDAELVGDHVVAARALVHLAWEARPSSRVDAAREMVQGMRPHAEAARFDHLPSHSRVEAIAGLGVGDGEQVGRESCGERVCV